MMIVKWGFNRHNSTNQTLRLDTNLFCFLDAQDPHSSILLKLTDNSSIDDIHVPTDTSPAISLSPAHGSMISSTIVSS